MRRFAFSRSRNRSISRSDSIKDVHDPDQRPITISSYQKTRNKKPIVKPRIYTSNFITNRSSIADNSEIDHNNLIHPAFTYNNIMSIENEYSFTDSNSNLLSQRSIELSSPPYSADYVSVQLPSYINPDDLKYTGEEYNKNRSIYSPPDIKSPTASQYNVIKRLINTSHQIDRLGQSYSSQSNRSNYNASRITTVDTYKEIAKKTFKNNDNNDNQNEGNETKEFLAQYLLDHTKHENAKVIQKAFRLSRNRSHFKRFIRINMTINYNLKKLTFCLWRLTTVNRTDQLISLFKKVKGLYPFIIRHFKIHEFAPFRLYYVTQQLFLPKGYTAERVYKFFYLMQFNSMSRIFRIWVRYTKNHAKIRKALIPTRFAGKKFSKFGFIYHIFINWYRLTRWKSEARENPNKKYIILSQLNQHEVNIFWNVREHNLNIKRSRIKRATEFSIKRIAAKAIRALYNRSIESTSEKSIIETADMFRNMHLQSLSHRAWLKFMQKRFQDHQVLRDTMHAWYCCVYLLALKKMKDGMADRLYIENFTIKVLNGWFRQAREKRIRRVAMTLRIHKKPSSMFFIIFALQKDFDLAFHVLCFRMWIRFTRTRKKWHLFVRWCMKANIDNSPIAEKERKIIVLNDLRRAAHLKIIKRSCSPATSYLPRHTWMSVELTHVALHQIKFIQSHRTIDFNSPNVKNNQIFKDQSEVKTWQFLTEKIPNEKEKQDKSLDFSAQTLIRCFLLKLQKQKNYEMARIKDTFNEGKVNPELVQFRTLDELESQANFNISLLRKHTIEKVRRDHATLASLLSHISAQRIQNTIRNFSTTEFNFDKEDQPIKTNYIKSDNYDSLRTSSTLEIGEIFVYPEVNELIDFLIKENSQAVNKLASTYERTKEKMMLDFQRKFRNPNYFNTGEEIPNNLIVSNMSNESLLDSYRENSTISLLSMENENDSNSNFKMNLSQARLLSSRSNFSVLSSATTSPLKYIATPVKNPLINSYVKPSSKNSSENLMMSLFEESSERSSSSSNFTIENFRRVLEKYHSQDDITQSLVIFFSNICQVQLDVSEVKSLSKPDELLPCVNLNKKKNSAKINREKNANTSQIENINNDDSEIIIQTHRHSMQKNMNVFMAEVSGFTDDLDHLPLKMIFSTNVENCISAIFTIFNALKKNQTMSQYLDLTPFSTRLKSTDELLITTQDKTWSKLKSMFPKIELPNESTMISLNSLSKRRSTFASSLFQIGNVQNIDEVMGSNEAYLGCFLLPYILSFDSVFDFIKDEMKFNHK